MTDTATTTAPPRTEKRTDLATNLRVAVLRMSRCLRTDPGYELSEAQHSVLAALVNLGPMSPGQLAEHDKVQRPSMTRTVAALEERGYVTRTSNPEDKRQVVVAASDAGRQLVKEVKRRRNAWLDKRLAKLTPAERETLAEAARIMRRMVEQ
ncbi:MarR family transcriptional regulator [Georgenia sp. TF02-10]|uniref:MarR family winged helix-turn-helix transcriptional regulator n=1 Tax=Georgenia sp. TF02-10 TaxID=2917725 RepID=UPI001FA7526A|nr:MarR family transcriptional regulator [Georgenia sp. TF02-10]UNX55398.1 MarR family transcriptional regulator [Georgenia sp. TF02-10]